MPLAIAALAVYLHSTIGAIAATEDLDIQGAYLGAYISHTGGGAIEQLDLLQSQHDLAAGEGLLLEGFGVGSFYVPNRRLNQKLEILEQFADRPVLRFSYDCDGPNIKGLRVERIMEILPDEASIRVQWKVSNGGAQTQWVAPWVRNEASPGGSFDQADHVDVPALQGLQHTQREGYHPAARNWAAATDSKELESLYSVYDATQLHSVLAVYDEVKKAAGFQAAFVPAFLKPGESWSTTYRLNAVRGLSRVDFATDEMAAQIDYANGELSLLISATKAIPNVELHASVLAPGGEVWQLEPKRFAAAPDKLIRCTFAWIPPANGAYEFLGKLKENGKDFPLGGDTSSPHGGIDTQFTVGEQGPSAFAAWTDAPHILDHSAREIACDALVSSPFVAWFSNSLDKIFPEDQPIPSGRRGTPARIALARNERESFQLALHPPAGTDSSGVHLRVGDLEALTGSGRISAAGIDAYRVANYDVRVPSNFEGPTGAWPDALPPLEPFTALGGRNSAIWITVYAPPDTPPGMYRGAIELRADGIDPVPLAIEAEVHAFALPDTPSLKTDFGFWSDAAFLWSQHLGYKGTQADLDARYLENAFAHRVTLRDLVALPSESADYRRSLAEYEPRLRQALRQGATSVHVPPSLLDTPEQLALANAFVAKMKLQGKAFSQIADEPAPPAWPRLFERMQVWNEQAPDVPLMTTTFGLQPFLSMHLPIWAVHLPLMDTVNNTPVIKAVAEGQEVWTYVNHSPPRPYGNFFIDFAGIEHRILFWQTWALNFQGFHYWSINYTAPGQNPWQSQLDITPANGNGFLVYPSPAGPVNSIRWEVIRDGIEDFDYLMLLRERIDALQQKRSGHPLLREAQAVYDLEAMMPNLVTFTRDPGVLFDKRAAIADMIDKLGEALRQ